MIRRAPSFGVLIEAGVDGFAWQQYGLRVVASWGEGWDHVSVSRKDRVPSYAEMNYIARTFFPDETCMELHVPPSEHINVHPHCLHMWRPQNGAIPKPPGWMVA